MTVTLVVPGQLRELASGRRLLSVSPLGDTVGDTFEALRAELPALYDRIFTEQRELRPHVNVFVDRSDIRWVGGLDTRVCEGSEVVILPAVSGG
jgi:molybdopterin synthase sulfur carrier subunit